MTRGLFIAAVLVPAALAAPAAAAARADQMVVFRGGAVRASHPAMSQTTAKVAGRRCTIAGATPLAVLVHSGVGPLGLRDYGSCSKRPADGGGLFVSAIGADRNKGSDGWVYKAGNVLGTAGAADPAGPIGRGRIRAGTRVTWFWCHVTKRDAGCPHTLGVAAVKTDAGTLAVRVRRYDDRGKPAAAPEATVHAGSLAAAADSSGVARFALNPGSYRVWAEQPGRIRSFTSSMVVQ